MTTKHKATFLPPFFQRLIIDRTEIVLGVILLTALAVLVAGFYAAWRV